MATEIPMVQAVERDWNTAPVKERDVKSWDITTDVVIAGYGGAGVCAAIEVVEAGADVLALECRESGGGTTITSLSKGSLAFAACDGTHISVTASGIS